ncbi:DNA-binding MarR family transcriptional regulator [Leucobacter exalbidus]|uniref:DNA-binding MarR family transcriptional regulator n=1 Tax=Leucobacter exalbidus TaxID=662960 RepID=A0A940PS71_9MICO|nr:MarR family transcriptional regulator [Leucobacter exalbidus]MBP1325265.1 DNA-binding MarR family transcriptional regulator [Leucobacter exalbidus]
MEPTILDRILAVSALFDRETQRAFADTGLTETRVHALRVLYHGGPSTQQQLAKILGTTPRSVSALVDGLTAAGFARRNPHPTDRRAVLVTLTEHAERAMLKVQASREWMARELMGAVAPDDREAFERGLNAAFWHMSERSRAIDERQTSGPDSTPISEPTGASPSAD